MKEEPESFVQPLMLAGEWGITLAILTTAGALLGYWLGGFMHNRPLTVVLVLFGIVAGFALGVSRMMRVLEQRTASKDSIQTKKAETPEE
jgi:F0F1-type ATP synthase assembly protein I